jgi:hypothetical protein
MFENKIREIIPVHHEKHMKAVTAFAQNTLRWATYITGHILKCTQLPLQAIS